MTRLVLHIGLHKTGTTAFQSFISHNRDELAKQGLHYPDMFRGPNHAELAVAFSSRITRVSVAYDVQSEADRARLRGELPRLLADARSQPGWIASSEHLTTMLRKPKEIRPLAEFLHGIFDDVLVLVTLRRADYWLPSMYVESIKSGGTRPLDEFFVQRHRYLLDHRWLFRRWSNAFGRGNVRAIPFLESDKNDPTALPARILAAAGIPPDVTTQWPTRSKVSNTSLSGYGTELLRRMNTQRSDSPLRTVRLRPPVVRAVRNNWPGPAPLLPPDAAAEVRRRDWVRTRIARHRFALAGEWDEWLRHPDADTGPLPDVSTEDVQKLIRILRRKGLLSAVAPPRPPAPRRRLTRRQRYVARLRRVAGRARKRLLH